MSANTVFLRLEGPLQAWGVTSRFVIRETADVPSKSGVLGLVCAAMGLRRGDATGRLTELAALRMGVRIDRPGTKLSDYHTAGAGDIADARAGMMTAAGKIKVTQTSGELETHVMRKEYLADAAFLVALQGDLATVDGVAKALDDPVWPPFLGRKCCPPSAPVLDKQFAPLGEHLDLETALRSVPWRPRLPSIDTKPDLLWAVVEAKPADGRPVQDVPVSFTHRVYATRFVRDVELKGVVESEQSEFTPAPRPARRPVTELPGWKDGENRRQQRLNRDHGLCVFCKEPARDVHHRTYARAGSEDIENDLRSVCRLCHDALTLLEYAGGMGEERIDPCHAPHRDAILAQRRDILTQRDRLRRRRNRAKHEEED